MGFADRFSLDGKTAFVTGASYGLGVGFAKALAEAGANVVLAARSVDKLADVAGQLDGLGVKTLVQYCDVTDPATVRAAVTASWETFGRIDVLVNNAGVIAETGIMPERIPDEMFAQTMNTNVNGLFTCCREVGSRQLADGKGGSIINVASVAGLGAQPHFPTGYQASKAAVINLTRNLAASWASRGVRVNALCPGFTLTPMVQQMLDAGLPTEQLVARVPLGRLGTSEEVAATALYLCSEAAAFMVGHALAIDGGITAS